MSTHKTVEDGRARSWWWMENKAVDDLWIAFVGVYAWAVYTVLVRHADDRGRAMPSAKEIAGITGISVREVRKSLKILLGSGLIRRSKKGSPTTPTVYQVRALPDSKNHIANPRPSDPPKKEERKVIPIRSQKQREADATAAFLAEVDPPEPEPRTEDEKRDMKAALTKAADNARKQARAPQVVKAPTKQRRRLPKNWKPNDTHRRIATEEKVDIEREVVNFRDHAEATGRVMLDWDAAFRTWLKRARGFDRAYYGSDNGKSQKQRASEEVAAFYQTEEVV